ncbi:MAG: PadR family transcriptional regulator [Halieaceae bacterium]|nr:PadR family transcriptional regulator [Halieaceae bacterium]
MKFNTITYSVMGILLRQPRTGYDVVKDLKSFRPAKSSQIYPILANLEKARHATVEVERQTGRPDKKIYKLTPSGKALLLDWLDTEPEPPVTRDDFLSMFFSVWAKGPDAALRLLRRRKDYLIRYERDVSEKHDMLIATYPDETQDPFKARFCSKLLYRRRMALVTEELRWCNDCLAELE